MKKHIFYTELAYIVGLILIALSAAFSVKADFGVSMIIAPAYILHLGIGRYLPFFTFGTAEYCLQAVIVVIMAAVVRKFKVSYVLTFATAVLYGFLLDGLTLLVSPIPDSEIWQRIVLYVLSVVVCDIGVALMFKTYLPPEAYDFFVREISDEFSLDITKVKTVYDFSSLTLGIILSFSFFGLWHFEGVKWGTVVCTLVNGLLIGYFSKQFDRIFEFRDLLKWRDFFSGKKKEKTENN